MDDGLKHMLTTALLSLLFQAADGAPPHGGPPPANCPWCSRNIAPVADSRPWTQVDEEQQFVRRLNGLAVALADFSHTYTSQGLIDVKKVKAIRKALRELEKSDWFNPKGEPR
jgi:hypothetical protein